MCVPRHVRKYQFRPRPAVTAALMRSRAAVASHVSRTSSPGTLVGTPSCTKVLWHQFSRQYTPGHRTVFTLRFSIGVFVGMCLIFFIGGSILLSQTLSLVQMRAVYSDSPPMSNFSNAERSLLLQGQGALQRRLNCLKQRHVAVFARSGGRDTPAVLWNVCMAWAC